MKKLQVLILALSSMFWMHTAFCQPLISVWGSEDDLSVKQEVTQYLEYLDIRENIRLSIRFTTRMPEKQEGMTFCLASPAPNACQIMKIWIDSRLSKKQQKLVLAHEMIHVKQYAKGELIVLSKQQVMWKGRKYVYQQADRQRVPWEKEAYRTDNLLAKRYKEQPDKPLELEKPLIASKTNP